MKADVNGRFKIERVDGLPIPEDVSVVVLTTDGGEADQKLLQMFAMLSQHRQPAMAEKIYNQLHKHRSKMKADN